MALMSAVVYTPKEKKKRRPGVWYFLGSTNKASVSRPVGREREGAIAYLFRHLNIRGKERLLLRIKRGNHEIFANQRQGLAD